MNNSLDTRLAEIADVFAALDASDYGQEEFADGIWRLEGMRKNFSSVRTDEVLMGNDWFKIVYNDEDNTILRMMYGNTQDEGNVSYIHPSSKEGQLVRRFVANFSARDWEACPGIAPRLATA